MVRGIHLNNIKETVRNIIYREVSDEERQAVRLEDCGYGVILYGKKLPFTGRDPLRSHYSSLPIKKSEE